MLRRRPHEHPYAIPPIPGGRGLWLIRQGEADPLGYVLMRPMQAGFVFDIYAHCRDAGGRRPWLHTAPTFNSAVAWTVQHDLEIRALIAWSSPELEEWPAWLQCPSESAARRPPGRRPAPPCRVALLEQVPPNLAGSGPFI